MHSSKCKDPLISRPQPVTLVTPVIEESLRSAGIAPVHEPIVERFMAGQPRIAVVHGGEDHPPNLGSRETVRRPIRQVWTSGALPFEVSQSMPCEELVQGTSRPLRAATRITICGHLESSLNLACVVLTDGRVSFQHDGISIAHVVPEAIDGGCLAAIRTGDWIYMDIKKGALNVVAQSRHGSNGFKVLSTKDLLNHPDRRNRINELERRRTALLPSFRILLDQVSSAETGV